MTLPKKTEPTNRDLMNFLWEMRKDIKEIKTDVANITSRCERLEIKNQTLRKENDKLTLEIRRNNLMFSNIEDHKNETPQQLLTKITDVIVNGLGLQGMDIDTVTRTGEQKPEKTRRVRVRFVRQGHRDQVWNKRMTLKPKNNPIYINQDEPQRIIQANIEKRQLRKKESSKNQSSD
ncbi:unnamed protein product [Allacma fusca]|uniref:Uncharacterized protein n=1 Tax=Allacma fusca TaxID=39272 RepID=A0A8J2P5R3_9HEXA|nr:unnamed protein product [Allacma fusca]